MAKKKVDAEPGRDVATNAAAVEGDDTRLDLTLRPKTLDEYIGQDEHRENLKVFVSAARKRNNPLDHVLISGPPGLGKTTLALILANELGVSAHTTSGPAIEHKGALAGMLTKLESRDLLFIDEIHRLTPIVEENLYPAMEDFKIDLVTGDGPHATTIPLNIHPFTLVGATTRTGLITGPLQSRFGIVLRLDFYTPEQLATIVRRSARPLGTPIAADAALEIARRARGTPRIANRLLRRARDFADVAGLDEIDQRTASPALDRMGAYAGLDEMDRRLLRILIEYYDGADGIETLAAAVAEPRDTLEDVYEPYLREACSRARRAGGWRRAAPTSTWNASCSARRVGAGAPSNGTTPPSPPTSAQARLEAITARRVRDPYADLLRDSRGMRREVSRPPARAWPASLALDRKEDVLFELETLLKSVVAWSNPRNQPRRANTPRAADRDFHPHLLITRAVVARALALCNQLVGAHKSGPLQGRTLARGFREDPTPPPDPPGEGPTEALLSLRSCLGVHLVVLDGIARGTTVPFRLFFATADALRREVARNPCFNPMQVLEFRPEFDRIRSPEVLDALQSVDGEAPHRVVALAFLAHFRLLRLAQLLQHTALDPTASRRAYAVLAVIRAEQRSLCAVLGERVGEMLADAVEREMLKVSSTDLKVRYDTFSREVERQRLLRVTLTTAAAALDAECRRALLLRVSPCDDPAASAELGAQCSAVAQRLREALQDNLLQLAVTLRGAADAERVVGDRSARRAVSERLRQQAWGFLVVLRAFIEKARVAAVDEGDRWERTPSSTFATDFVQHFERIGRVLAARSEYAEAPRLTHAVLALRETDVVSRRELDVAVKECAAFAEWLQSFVAVGRREELRAIPLDRGAAARRCGRTCPPRHDRSPRRAPLVTNLDVVLAWGPAALALAGVRLAMLVIALHTALARVAVSLRNRRARAALTPVVTLGDTPPASAVCVEGVLLLPPRHALSDLTTTPAEAERAVIETAGHRLRLDGPVRVTAGTLDIVTPAPGERRVMRGARVRARGEVRVEATREGETYRGESAAWSLVPCDGVIVVAAMETRRIRGHRWGLSLAMALPAALLPAAAATWMGARALAALGAPGIELVAIEGDEARWRRVWSGADQERLARAALSPLLRGKVQAQRARAALVRTPFPPQDREEHDRLAAVLRANGDCTHEALLALRSGRPAEAEALGARCADPAAGAVRREARCLLRPDDPQGCLLARIRDASALERWRATVDAAAARRNATGGDGVRAEDPGPVDARAEVIACALTTVLRDPRAPDGTAASDLAPGVWDDLLAHPDARCRVLGATRVARRDAVALGALTDPALTTAHRALLAHARAYVTLVGVDQGRITGPICTERPAPTELDAEFLAANPAVALALLRAGLDSPCAWASDRVVLVAAQAFSRFLAEAGTGVESARCGGGRCAGLDDASRVDVGHRRGARAAHARALLGHGPAPLDRRYAPRRRGDQEVAALRPLQSMPLYVTPVLDEALARDGNWPGDFTWVWSRRAMAALRAPATGPTECSPRSAGCTSTRSTASPCGPRSPRQPQERAPLFASLVDYWRTGTWAPARDAPAYYRSARMRRVVDAAAGWNTEDVLRVLGPPDDEGVMALAAVAPRLTGRRPSAEHRLRVASAPARPPPARPRPRCCTSRG
ncbi:MAG: Holliday junction branch migration DNA helicase RuvB [Polyangiales bacterium]